MKHSPFYFSRNDIAMFWMGLLTGAVIVSLVFIYRLYSQGATANILKTSPSYRIEKNRDPVKDPGWDRPAQKSRDFLKDPGWDRPAPKP